MISIRKILVPVALSPACAWAARYAAALADKFGRNCSSFMSQKNQLHQN
jgi:hypothetical protein